MNRNITRRLLLASGVVAALVSLAVASGVRVNTTASVPKGLYRITGEAARVETGEAVFFRQSNLLFESEIASFCSQ